MVAATSTFLELGENDRFRFMTGSLVVMGVMVVIEAIARAVARHRTPGARRAEVGP